MRSLTFDKLFAVLTRTSVTTAELARLMEWIAGIAHPAECIALIEQAARGRPCPHCHCSRSHRCGQASGLQRFRCLGCRRGINREHDCLLVARDRNGHTLDFHTGRGQVTAGQLATCLCPVLPIDVLLISDSAAAYRRFCADAGITHETVNVRAGVRSRGAIHIQNVNAWHSRFKSWLVRFRGVASRYLANYSGWQRVLDARCLTTPAQLLCAAVQFD